MAEDQNEDELHAVEKRPQGRPKLPERLKMRAFSYPMFNDTDERFRTFKTKFKKENPTPKRQHITTDTAINEMIDVCELAQKVTGSALNIDNPDLKQVKAYLTALQTTFSPLK